MGEKIPADIRKEIEEKLEDLKKVKDTSDTAVLKSKTEALSQTIQKIGVDLYKQAQPDQTGNQSADEKKDGEEPKEGEFREK